MYDIATKLGIDADSMDLLQATNLKTACNDENIHISIYHDDENNGTYYGYEHSIDSCL